MLGGEERKRVIHHQHQKGNFSYTRNSQTSGKLGKETPPILHAFQWECKSQVSAAPIITAANHANIVLALNDMLPKGYSPSLHGKPARASLSGNHLAY